MLLLKRTGKVSLPCDARDDDGRKLATTRRRTFKQQRTSPLDKILPSTIHRPELTVFAVSNFTTSVASDFAAKLCEPMTAIGLSRGTL